MLAFERFSAMRNVCQRIALSPCRATLQPPSHRGDGTGFRCGVFVATLVFFATSKSSTTWKTTPCAGLNSTALAKRDVSSDEDAAEATPNAKDFPRSPGALEHGLPSRQQGACWPSASLEGEYPRNRGYCTEFQEAALGCHLDDRSTSAVDEETGARDRGARSRSA